jgi:hypothetical protein
MWVRQSSQPETINQGSVARQASIARICFSRASIFFLSLRFDSRNVLQTKAPKLSVMYIYTHIPLPDQLAIATIAKIDSILHFIQIDQCAHLLLGAYLQLLQRNFVPS